MESDNSKKPKRRGTPWTTGEKWLLGSIVLAVIGGFGIWTGFNSLEQMPDIKIPTRAEPSPNGYSYFVAAGTVAVEGPGRTRQGPLWKKPPPETGMTTPPSATEIAADLKAGVSNTRALALVRQGLALPCMTPQRHDPNVIAPWAKMRHLARSLKDTANVQAAHGKYPAAMRTALDCVDMGNRMTIGATTVELSVANACQSAGRITMWPIVSHLDTNTARSAAQRLYVIDSQETPVAENLRAQEYATEEYLMQIFAKPSWRAQLLAEPGSNGEANAVQARALAFVSKRALLDAYQKEMEATIADVHGTFRAKPRAPSSGIQLLLYNTLDGMTGNAWFTSCQKQADNRLLATALALRAYQVDHGQYPKSLQALAPAYLPSVPQDPFGNGPLTYKLAGNAYMLYSLGPDGKDDGGKTNSGSTGHGFYYELTAASRGDIVAGVNE